MINCWQSRINGAFTIKIRDLTAMLLLVQHKGNSSVQACAQAGVAVQPRRRDALLFYSLQADGQLVRTHCLPICLVGCCRLLEWPMVA